MSSSNAAGLLCLLLSLLFVIKNYYPLSNSDNTPSVGEDFYHHVNKKWIDDPENVIPAEYSHWGGFTKLHDESLKNQILLFNELTEKKELSEDERRLCLIWNASMAKYKEWDEEKPEDITKTSNYVPITFELSKLNEIFKNENEDLVIRLGKYISYTQRYGISGPLDFDKGSDLTSSMDIILDLAPSGLSLPSRDYYFDEKFEEQRTMFKTHLSNVVKLLSDANIQLEEDFEEKVFSFESDLAFIKMKRDQSRQYSEYFTNTSLAGVIKDIDSLNSLKDKLENYPEDKRELKPYSSDDIEILNKFMEVIYEELNLRFIMKQNYEENYKTPGDEERLTKLAVYDGDYFRRVFRDILFDSSNESKLTAYFQYKLILASNPYCTKQLNEEFFDFYSRKLSGQKEQKSNEKRSIQRVNSWTGELLGKIYVDRYFSLESKTTIEEMINTVLDIMKISLENNDWLTQPTKDKALVKLSKFKKKIGFPDKWKEYSQLILDDNDSLYDIKRKITAFKGKTEFLDKLNTIKDLTEWLMTPQTVNAYFMPPNNEIVFPAAILQPPFFFTTVGTIDFDYPTPPGDVDVCLAANFGAIGAVIAHEITHGFDDQGRKFDGDGNLIDWWTPEDADLFKSKCDIMGKQAEVYTFTVKDKDDKEVTHKMNAQLTMGENLADLGGLSLGKKALLKNLNDKSDESVRASLNIFFRSWANVWKFKASDELRVNRLATDPHGPPDFRGNLVKHIDDFYSVFDVKEGEPMYIPAEQRVCMW